MPRRVLLNRVLDGVIRWEVQTNITAGTGNVSVLDYDKVNAHVVSYLDRYKDVYQFFKIKSITQRVVPLDPDVLNTADAKMRTWAKCYDAEAHGRIVASSASVSPMNEMLKNPSCQRAVWRPGTVFLSSLKPHWTVPRAYSETYNVQKPWWTISQAAAVPNSANGVHQAFTTPSATTISSFWTVRLAMKGRDNDMQYQAPPPVST